MLVFNCMDLLIEILANIFFTPICSLLFEKPCVELERSNRFLKMPTLCRILVLAFIVIAFIAMWFAIIFGVIMLAMPKMPGDKITGTICLSVGLSALFVYVVVVIVCINIKDRHRRKRRTLQRIDGVRPDKTSLRKIVHVVVDRPLGSTHPEHDDIVYGVNYGFVPTAMGGDGEPQDAYILGVDEPISEFDGVVVAIIHRLDDEEDKWVVAPQGVLLTDGEILEKTEFQEKYFQTELIRR